MLWIVKLIAGWPKDGDVVWLLACNELASAVLEKYDDDMLEAVEIVEEGDESVIDMVDFELVCVVDARL